MDPSLDDLHNGPTKEDLPSELQQAPAESTCCEFCGVSYLIYSEMSEMKDKLRRAELKAQEYVRKAAEYDDLADELAKLKEINCEYENRLQKSDIEFEFRLKALNDEVKRLNELNYKMQDEMHALESGRRVLKATIDKKNSAMRRIKLDLQASKGEIVDLKEFTEEKLKDEASRMKKMFYNVTKFSSVIVELERERDQLKDTVIEIQKYYTESQDKCTQLKEELKSHQDKLRNNSETSGEMEAQLNTLREKLNIYERESVTLKSKVERLEARNFELEGMSKDRNSAQQAEITSLRSEISILRDTVDSVTVRCNQAEGERDDLRNSLGNFDKELEEALHKLREREIELDSERAENGALSRKLEDIERNFNNNDRECNSLRDACTTLQNRLTVAEQAYRGNVTQLEHEMRQKSEELQTAKSEIQSLNHKIKTLTNDIEQAHTDLELERERNNMPDPRTMALQADKIQLQERVKSISSELDSRRAEITSLQRQIQDVQANAAEAQREFERNNSNRAEMEHIKRELSEKSAEVSDLEQTVHRQVMERMDLLQEVQQLRQGNAEILPMNPSAMAETYGAFPPRADSSSRRLQSAGRDISSPSQHSVNSMGSRQSSSGLSGSTAESRQWERRGMGTKNRRGGSRSGRRKF
eukprot:TRINITY_DN780062_c0_g1_i1.p1 TRINITY_DN780062_c0_g1~~TRINITY_DN780062_c0_g1_i1.p1  ORF type:complete len:644 (-),score=175.22 TRINITY_DN780062_c0_g1_i1:216-2147(-)